MNLQNSYNRYIIIGCQRSGTTVTHMALRGHPNISAINDEIKVSPLFAEGLGVFTWGGNPELTEQEKKNGVIKLFDTVAGVKSNENTIAIGLKIAESQPNNASQFVDCLQNYLSDIKIILTIREDLVAQYGSILRRRVTGQIGSWNKNQYAGDFKVKISESDFANYAVNCLKTLNILNKLEETHQVKKVIYEQDILPNDWNIYYELFSFLGLPKITIDWLDSDKVSPAPQEYIVNYNKLQDIVTDLKSQDINNLDSNKYKSLLEKIKSKINYKINQVFIKLQTS